MKRRIIVDGKPCEIDIEAESTGAICYSPLAGQVVRVNVRPGQQVRQNDSLLVIEAMKMETEVTSSFTGKVRAIHVNPGDAVKLGQVLVEFE